MAQSVQEYCTECGARLVVGACLWHPPTPSVQPLSGNLRQGSTLEVESSKRRRRSTTSWSKIVVAALLATMMIGSGLTYRVLFSDGRALRALRAEVSALRRVSSANRSTDESLGQRVTAIESDSNSQIHPAALAEASLGSVFTIVASGRFGTSLGSGFVVSSSGGVSILVTDFHVVGDAWNEGNNEVKVRQGDQSYVGTITRVSQDDDLAAISVTAELPVLILDEDRPAVGDPLVVIGSPYGLEGTVATGVVSANRPGYIQFSAPVSPGDSGGPVLEADGSVVGITVSKMVAHAAEGLAFATPMATVCRTVVDC